MRDRAAHAAEEAGLGDLKGVYDDARFPAWFLTVTVGAFAAILVSLLMSTIRSEGMSGRAYAGFGLLFAVVVSFSLILRSLFRDADGGIVHFDAGIVLMPAMKVCAWRDVTEVHWVRLSRAYRIITPGGPFVVSRGDYYRCGPLMKVVASLAAALPND